MSRMLGLISTKWATFMPYRSAKESGRRQARAIDKREVRSEITDLLSKEPNLTHLAPWLKDDDFDAQRAEDCYQSHPWTPGEGRCTECFTDRVDAFVYFIRCHADRVPVTYTSETS
jgi:hypothetical protein